MEDLRERIVNMASNNMNKVGIRSVSVDDICRQMGISKKTFYVHFATKDELVDAVLRKQEQTIDNNMLVGTDKKTVLEVLVGSMQIVQRSKEILQPPPFLYDLQKYYPKLFEAHKNTVYFITKQHLVRFLQRGVAENIFCGDIDIMLTAQFLARLHQGLMEVLTHPDGEREEFVNMCRHGLKLIMRGIITEYGKILVSNALKETNNEYKQ